jgi:hypothetical protein
MVINFNKVTLIYRTKKTNLNLNYVKMNYLQEITKILVIVVVVNNSAASEYCSGW